MLRSYENFENKEFKRKLCLLSFVGLSYVIHINTSPFILSFGLDGTANFNSGKNVSVKN